MHVVRSEILAVSVMLMSTACTYVAGRPTSALGSGWVKPTCESLPVEEKFPLTPRIRLKVIDEFGGAVPYALISLRRDADSAEVSWRTDNEGEAGDLLGVGRWSMLIESFGSRAAKFSFDAEIGTSCRITVALRFDDAGAVTVY